MTFINYYDTETSHVGAGFPVHSGWDDFFYNPQEF